MNSMTGFGRGVAEHDGREATVEIKTVNNRYVDVSFRMPRLLNQIEGRIRNEITAAIMRGKVDVSISYRNRREDHAAVAVDIPLARAYQRAFETLRETTGLHNDLTLTTLAASAAVLTAQEAEEDEEAVCHVVQQALDQAMNGLSDMRQREGQRLKDDLTQKIRSVRELVDQVRVHAPEMEQAAKDRLMEKMKEYYEADETLRQRVLTEAAILADKRAIDEEVVRLQSHLEEFLYNLDAEEPVGRKLDFIVQEMHREVNTIGSKAGERNVNALVISIKSAIEKIREQIQNIE